MKVAFARLTLTALLLSGACWARAAPLTTLTFKGITGNSAVDTAAGESQLRADVSATATSSSFADFKFYHAGTTQMTVAAVYFDDGGILQGIGSLTGSGPGVSFTAGSVSPTDLPGGDSITPKFEVTAGLAADADSPAPKYGISPGESLTVRFNLKAGNTFQSVLDELTTGQLRLGLHVIAFASGGSEAFVNGGGGPSVVPAPMAALGGVALLGALVAGTAFSRRRQRAAW